MEAASGRPGPRGRAAPVPPFAYTVHGMAVASAIELPELDSRDGDSQTSDLEIHRVDALPVAPETVDRLSVTYHNGAVLLSAPGVARYLIRGGAEVLVCPVECGDPAMVRLYLLGTALGIIAHQRGQLPLHASVAVAGERAFGFAGPPGAGKSTLAGALHRAGLAFLCDDTCVVSFDEDGRAWAAPGFARIKLWQDSAAALQYITADCPRVLPEIDKYQVGVPDNRCRKAVPLERIYLIDPVDDQAGGQAEIEKVTGINAVDALSRNTHRGFIVAGLGLHEEHFRQVARLVRSVAVYRLRRAADLTKLDATVSRVLQNIKL